MRVDNDEEEESTVVLKGEDLMQTSQVSKEQSPSSKSSVAIVNIVDDELDLSKALKQQPNTKKKTQTKK